jgi:hypothetical protein
MRKLIVSNLATCLFDWDKWRTKNKIPSRPSLVILQIEGFGGGDEILNFLLRQQNYSRLYMKIRKMLSIN